VVEPVCGRPPGLLDTRDAASARYRLWAGSRMRIQLARLEPTHSALAACARRKEVPMGAVRIGIARRLARLVRAVIDARVQGDRKVVAREVSI
jgi:hypothetical protein